MKQFAIISHHQPDRHQQAAAQSKGINLHWIGSIDGFFVSPGTIANCGNFDGVIVSDAASAMNLCSHYEIGIFQNGLIQPEGEPPLFTAIDLHIYCKQECQKAA